MGRFAIAGCLVFFACSESSPTDPRTTLREGFDGGFVATAPGDKPTQLAVLKDLEKVTAGDLAAMATAVPNQTLDYDPGTATWLDLIQGSVLALNQTELEVYQKNGFVITPRQSFPNFFSGYKAIYAADLPVYVSADSVLYAFHRSYDAILTEVERNYLAKSIRSLLAAARARIAGASMGANAKKDLDCLLGVAALLLNPEQSETNSEVLSLAAKATAATGMEIIQLFGQSRMMDFSQFTPRGHYNDLGTMANYFRAMTWLGRTEFRLVDVDKDGNRTLNRREVEATLAMGEIFTPEMREQWKNVDQVLELFVGEADYMTLPKVDALKAALGIADSTKLSTISDTTLLKTIDAGAFGLQRIASQLMITDPGMTTLPNSFALFGQRYIIDSHIFTKVVYPATIVKRMMPNSLDVAYAALGNDQAVSLLQNDLAKHDYAEGLAKARQLVDWHGDDYWNSSLYTYWVSALRELSPGKQTMTMLPTVARTEAWGRRILNTQLASWAELRHDTLLYAKQSYTGIPLCDYPDGYVDPYPGVFQRLKEMSTLAADRLSKVLSTENTEVVRYFRRFTDVATRLEGMARQELAGAPRTQADMDFLNDAVVMKRVSVICATIDRPSGWYPQLFFSAEDASKQDPTIADVHTQPGDESGTIVGKVLHVATGNPRLMVLSVDSCIGHRAYVGVVSAYHEQITNDFKRKTDQAWLAEVPSASDVPWMQPIVAH